MASPNLVAESPRRAGQRRSVSLLVVAACVATNTYAVAVGGRDGTRAAALASLPCRRMVTPSGDRSASVVRWHDHEDGRSRSTLDAWCRGVGPIVYQSQPTDSPGEPAPVGVPDAIAVVSWNVNVGAGNLPAFVADLRAGKWSNGRRTDHFVLLLQEALRAGETVPPRGPSQAGARRLRRRPPRVDIVAFARKFGLSLVYVPSMRNGLDPRAPSEDRGNAILSTLPLLAPGALELPFVRQRRVAVLAVLGGLEESDPLGVASVHLDHLVGANRLWVFGASRARGQQAREGTYSSGAVLDYLFFRMPAWGHATYERVGSTYGSDHYPLIGWISLGHTTRCRCHRSANVFDVT